MNKYSKIRKGRTLAITVDDLLHSPRLDIAIKLYNKGDRSLLRAILIELGMETMQVVKTAVIRRAIQHHDLDAFELKPFLHNLDAFDFNTFTVFWNLTNQERDLYLAIIEGKSEEELLELRNKALKKMGLE